MKDIKNLAKQYIKENRFKVLIPIIVYASISSLFSMIFQSVNLLWLSFIPTTLLSYVYLISIHDFTTRVVRNKQTHAKELFKKPTFTKRSILIFLSYVVWAALTLVLLRVLGSIPQVAALLIILMVAMFVFGNAVNHLLWFSDEKDFNLWRDYKTSIKRVIQTRSLLLYTLFRSITAVFQGAILVLCVNVFAFGPQIQTYLQLGEKESNVFLTQLFSNDISTFIQSTGVQTIVYYILFVSCVIYGTYARQKNIIKKR